MRQKKIKKLEFFHPKHNVIIKNKALKTFIKYSSKNNYHEAGGILLGSVYYNYVKIAKATVPNKYDSYGHNFFIRSKKGAQLHINKAWNKSKGTMIYLGEWHTHQEINPKPTAIDKNMILQSLSNTKMEIEFLYLIIIGLNNTFWVGLLTDVNYFFTPTTIKIQFF